ncbi:hypothetical protein XENOCAPTIV_007364, partial [Xenoophorus captivus]
MFIRASLGTSSQPGLVTLIIMASADETEGGLTPVDFIQLQHYMEESSLRVRDVIKEFHPGGRYAKYTAGE